jgi:hypothetical protein
MEEREPPEYQFIARENFFVGPHDIVLRYRFNFAT